jgi:hypothetical protein
LHVLNRYWNLKEDLPSEWVKAGIIPILKKGIQEHISSSYRPIALTSAIVKVQEKMLLGRLKWYLEKNNILAPEQAGFRENRSTSQQICRFTQEIKEALNKHESVLAVLVDFKGAYNTIWREKLINKLKLRGKMLNWLRRFLVERWISTKFNNTSSKYKQTKLGLPQGAIISPTIFNIYVNVLPGYLRKNGNTKCCLISDDLVIWTTAKNKSTQQQKLTETMNNALQALEKWAAENNMIIITQKTNYQFFSMQHNNYNFNLKINQDNLEKNENTKYLGISSDNKLK